MSSLAALICTADQSVSSMRMFRRVVPRAMSDGQRLNAFPAQVAHAGDQGGVCVGVFEAAHVAVRAAGKFNEGAVRVVHTQSVPTHVPTRKYLMAVTA